MPSNYEIIDHNVIPDLYVTYIVDLWEGDKTDPATEVSRFIALFAAGELETEEGVAFDPNFEAVSPGYRTSYYSKHSPRELVPEALVWDTVETIKEADKESLRYKEETERLLKRSESTYSGAKHNAEVDRYQAFLDAIDRLAAGDESEETYTAIDAWRNRLVERYEK